MCGFGTFGRLCDVCNYFNISAKILMKMAMLPNIFFLCVASIYIIMNVMLAMALNMRCIQFLEFSMDSMKDETFLVYLHYFENKGRCLLSQH